MFQPFNGPIWPWFRLPRSRQLHRKGAQHPMSWPHIFGTYLNLPKEHQIQGALYYQPKQCTIMGEIPIITHIKS